VKEVKCRRKNINLNVKEDKEMGTRRALKLLSICLITFCVSGYASDVFAQPAKSPSPEKLLELKFAAWTPPMSVTIFGMIEPWIKEVEKRSGGRVKITLFPAAAMGKPEDHYNMALTGLADISLIEPAWNPGVFPLSDCTSLPMIFPSSKVASSVYYELIEKYMGDREFKNVKVLWTICTPPSQIQMVKKQIRSRQDFSGQKILVTSRSGLKVIEKLGGTAMFIPMPEIYTALQRGVADGYCQIYETLVAFKTFEVTKARTEANLWTDRMVVIMNKDKWNKLPKDIKEIFTQTTGLQKSKSDGAIFDDTDKKLFNDVVMPYDKKNNNPAPYFLPKDELARWKDAIAPLYEEFIKENETKGLPARALFNDLLKLVEKHSK
jgi:TRAP-type C4-dicarboxylate transport system substrate-binding protein